MSRPTAGFPYARVSKNEQCLLLNRETWTQLTKEGHKHLCIVEEKGQLYLKPITIPNLIMMVDLKGVDSGMARVNLRNKSLRKRLPVGKLIHCEWDVETGMMRVGVKA